MRLIKVFGVLTAALGLFPLLKLNLFSGLMILWFILALIIAFKEKTYKNLSENIKIFILLSLFCWMYILYLPFASDFKEMNKAILKSMPFLVFPLGLLLNKEYVTLKALRAFGIIYIGSVVVLNLLGWVKIFNYGFFKAWNENDFYHPMFRTLFFEATNLHLPYLGLFSVFAALLLLYKMLVKKTIKIGFLIIIIFLLGSVYIYSARMALICFIIGFLYLVWKSIHKPFLKWSIITLVPLLCLSFLWFSPIKERYLKTIESEMVLPSKGQEPHEVNYRYGIWYCATQIISNHFLFGVGADQAQKELNQCYESFEYKSYEDFSQITYNSHNQYFDQFLKFGFFGFLGFCFSFFYFIPKSSNLYQVFIIIVAVSFLTENLLDRQMGVVFVSLLNSIFVIFKFKTFEKSVSS